MSIIFICYSQKQPDDSRLLSRCENVTRSFRIQCLFQLLSSTSKCILCNKGILFVSMYKTIEINYFQVRNNTVINLVNQTEGGNHNFLSQRVTLTGNQKLAWHAFRFPLRYLCSLIVRVFKGKPTFHSLKITNLSFQLDIFAVQVELRKLERRERNICKDIRVRPLKKIKALFETLFCLIQNLGPQPLSVKQYLFTSLILYQIIKNRKNLL